MELWKISGVFLNWRGMVDILGYSKAAVNWWAKKVSVDLKGKVVVGILHPGSVAFSVIWRLLRFK